MATNLFLIVIITKYISFEKVHSHIYTKYNLPTEKILMFTVSENLLYLRVLFVNTK